MTGAGSAFAAELATVISEVRRATTVPVGVGFGVNGPARARQVAAMADAVIVGAALCERMERGSERGLEGAVVAAEGFVAELAEAVGEVRKGPPAGGT